VRAQWYDPVTRRFLSEDPIGLAGGINPYTYAENDPVNLRDATGEDWDCKESFTWVFSGDVVWGVEWHRDCTWKEGAAPSWGGILGPMGGGGGSGGFSGSAGSAVFRKLGGAAPEIRGELVGFALSAIPIGRAAKLQRLVRFARLRYPNKIGVELHHNRPIYLGGDRTGPTTPLDAAYHQLITNAFRKLWGYGAGRPSEQVAEKIMRRVYQKFPLP